MAYLVVLTIELDRTTPSIPSIVERQLNDLGLYKTLVGTKKTPSSLPANTFAGEFTGSAVNKVRDDMTDSIVSVLVRNQVHSKLLINVGGDWGWATRTT